MIKSSQIAEINGEGHHYITVLTKPRIETLIKSDIVQLELFDENISEVRDTSGLRYILRRNPSRAKEIAENRNDKLASLVKILDEQNIYLKEHKNAHLNVAVRKVNEKAQKLKISNWVEITSFRRKIKVEILQDELKKISELDGCYIIKTDLTEDMASSETVHSRYKDLSKVESAFRCSKTAELELRPLYVRKESSTRGHVFVVMLAYMISRELARLWKDIDGTVQECLAELKTLTVINIKIQGKVKCSKIPTPREDIKVLIDKANVTMPELITCRKAKVATKTKLKRISKSI